MQGILGGAVVTPFLLFAILQLRQVEAAWSKTEIIGNRASDIDGDALLTAVGTPPCIRQCTKQLVSELKVVLHFQNLFDNIEFVCHEFSAAEDCIMLRSCPSAEIFGITVKGLKALCAKNMTQYLNENVDCLRPALDSNTQACDQTCHFVESVVNFSHQIPKQAGLVRFLHDASPTCMTLRCFLRCFRDRMNKDCAGAGGRLNEALLQPLFFFTDYLFDAPIGVKRFVASKVPMNCAFLTNRYILQMMSKMQ